MAPWFLVHWVQLTREKVTTPLRGRGKNMWGWEGSQGGWRSAGTPEGKEENGSPFKVERPAVGQQLGSRVSGPDEWAQGLSLNLKEDEWTYPAPQNDQSVPCRPGGYPLSSSPRLLSQFCLESSPWFPNRNGDWAFSLQTRLPGWQARANHSVTESTGGILLLGASLREVRSPRF